jgi:DNA primase large subunit
MLNYLGLFIDSSMIILFVALLGIVGLSIWFKKRKQKVLKIQSDKPKVDSNIEWTSFEFVQHLIKYPDTYDEDFVTMYENLLDEDTLEKDMEDYWKMQLAEDKITQEQFKKIKKAFNQRFKKIRKAAQAKEKSEDIAKWAVTNTDDDRNKDKKN